MGKIGGNCSQNGEAVNVLDAYVHIWEYMLQTFASRDGLMDYVKGPAMLINRVVTVYFFTALKYALKLLNRLLWIHSEYTGLFGMIVGVLTTCHLVLQMQPHVISFHGVTSRIRIMFLLLPQVSRN